MWQLTVSLVFCDSTIKTENTSADCVEVICRIFCQEYYRGDGRCQGADCVCFKSEEGHELVFVEQTMIRDWVHVGKPILDVVELEDLGGESI